MPGGSAWRILICLLGSVLVLPGADSSWNQVQGANGPAEPIAPGAPVSEGTISLASSTSKSSTKSGTKSKRRSSSRGSKGKISPSNSASYAAAIVVDSESGAVLEQKNADLERAPASLTKMMTVLLALEAVDRGDANLGDIVTVPESTRQVGGHRIWLKPGERMPLSEVLRAAMISSANDAAYTAAHHLAGSEGRFVERMNKRAAELGMTHTRYVNSHGLDRGTEPGSVTTARDQTMLARALLHHPAALCWSSTPCDTIRSGQVIRNTNKLLGQVDGLDGLKTGFTGRAGYCLVSTAERQNLRVISVLLGAPNSHGRFSSSLGLITRAFARYQKVPVVRKGQDLGQTLQIDGGTPSELRLVAGGDLDVVVPANRSGNIQVRVDVPDFTTAPVPAGEPLGLVTVMIGDSVACQAPVLAASASVGGHFERAVSRLSQSQ